MSIIVGGMAIERRREQARNARNPIVVSVDGSSVVVREERSFEVRFLFSV